MNILGAAASFRVVHCPFVAKVVENGAKQAWKSINLILRHGIGVGTAETSFGRFETFGAIAVADKKHEQSHEANMVVKSPRTILLSSAECNRIVVFHRVKGFDYRLSCHLGSRQSEIVLKPHFDRHSNRHRRSITPAEATISELHNRSVIELELANCDRKITHQTLVNEFDRSCDTTRTRFYHGQVGQDKDHGA